jgi:hypothetical protein
VPPPATPSFYQRTRTFVTTPIKIPGALLLLWVVFREIPDMKSRFDFWLDAAKSMGGYSGIAASILLSPWFTIAVFAAAIAWLFFVHEPKGVRHPVWHSIGWSVVGLFALLIFATAGYGGFEIEVRRLANARAIEIIKGNQSPGLNQGQDIHLSGGRGFSGKQTLILIQELAKLKGDIPNVYLSAPPGDVEAENYRFQLTQFLSRTGISWNNISETPASPDDTGLMIAVRDPENIPNIAQKVREAFEVADIHVGVTKMPAPYDAVPQIDLLLFFGPRPLL